MNIIFKNTFVIIIVMFSILFLSCDKKNTECDHSIETGGELTSSQNEKIKNEINNLRKMISVKLEKSGSIQSIKEYLYYNETEFKYENDHLTNESGNLLIIRYSGDNKKLGEIDKTMPFKKVIRVLKNGIYLGVSNKIVILYPKEKIPNPEIEFRYDQHECKWKLSEISFYAD